MRDFALTMVLLGVIPLILFRPHVGILAWAWVAFMNPHREVYSYLQGANLNILIAGLTIAGLIFAREKRASQFGLTVWVIFTFAVWTSLTTVTALNYDFSYDYWLRNTKTFIFLILIAVIIDRPSRIHALVFVIVISLGYWGVISALQTIASLGNARLTGPPNSMIADNNNLALAMVMTLPLVEYCRYVSKSIFIRYTCLVLLILLIVAILGTYSRGGFIALATVLGIYWWRGKNRLVSTSIIIVCILSMTLLLPQKWSDRMATIETYQEDQSFQGRLNAWKTAIKIGLDRPILGAGYRATEDPAIYSHYKSEGDTNAAQGRPQCLSPGTLGPRICRIGPICFYAFPFDSRL